MVSIKYRGSLQPVTRLTASSLPLSEWLSKRCNFLTSRHLPALTAFTIRT